MPERKYSYDPDCAVLARIFLDAEPNLPSTQEAIDNLAQTIQNAVEGWFEERQSEAFHAEGIGNQP